MDGQGREAHPRIAAAHARQARRALACCLSLASHQASAKRQAGTRRACFVGLTLQPTRLWVHSRQRRRTVAQSALQLEVARDGIGILTFDQPGSRANTLGQAILAELEAMVGQLKNRTELRGLVFRSGKPGMVIAGADLKELGML